MDPLPARLEVPRNRGFHIGGLQQFYSSGTLTEECNPDVFLDNELFSRRWHAEESRPMWNCGSQRVDRDSDVVDYGHRRG